MCISSWWSWRRRSASHPLIRTLYVICLRLPLELRDLAELQLDGGLPAEDVHEDLQLHLVFVDLGDGAGEVRERPFSHPNALADLEHRPVAGLLGPVGAGRLDLQDALDLFAGQRGGLGAQADEPGDARRVADDPPGVVVELAADQQVPREDLLLDGHPLAALELDDVLHGDDALEDAVL